MNGQDRKYIGLINSQQTFTNNSIKVDNDNNAVQNISDDTLGLINTNFDYLKNLLLDNQRSINYLDIYRIDKVLSDEEVNNIATEFALLSPGHSIGINGFISYNGDTYKKGDIVLKLVNGQPLHITGPTGGMFIPLIRTEGTTTTVSWYYSQSITLADGEYIYLGDSTSNPTILDSGNYFYFNTSSDSTGGYYIYTVSNPTWTAWDPNDDNSQFFEYSYTVPRPSQGMLRYNIQLSSPSTSYSFNIIYTDNNNTQILYPIIKYYSTLGSQGTEEVYVQDVTLIQDNDYWILDNIPSYVTSVMIY